MTPSRVLAIILAALAMFAQPASAHDWYPGTKDPVSGYGCCGANDCHTIPAAWLIQEGDGYRVRLTLEQAQYINVDADSAVDAFVPRGRIQPSQEANYAVCIYSHNRTAPTYGVICFFEPPGS